MDTDAIRSASELVSQSVKKAMATIREMEPGSDPVGAVCITVSDELTWAGLVAIPAAKLDALEGEERWDVHSWLNNYPDIDISPLNSVLDEPEIEEPDQVEACGYWLAALVHAMQQASLDSDGGTPYLFCTLIDSDECLWFENLSAKALTDASTFSRLAAEVAISHGCEEDEDPLTLGNQELRASFASALEALTG